MRLAEFLLPQIVFEARYFQGYRYLDRCGEVMIEIENQLKGWLAKDVSPVVGRMVYPKENMVFNFSSLKLDLAQYQVKDFKYDNFLKFSKETFSIVSKNLGIKEYVRFGLRHWLLYPVDSMNKGREILSKCKTYSINSELEKMFNGKIKDSSIVIVVEKEDSGHRIALSLVHKEGEEIDEEKNPLLTTSPHKLPKNQKQALMIQLDKAKKMKENPSMAVLVDIDNYFNKPSPEYLDKFLEESNKFTLENVVEIIGG